MSVNSQKLTKLFAYSLAYIVTGFIVFSLFILSPKEPSTIPIIRSIIVFFASILLCKYFLYMLVSPWHDVSVLLTDLKYAKALKNYNPRVSIMIPEWNESIGVIHTIETILKSTYTNLEIVVVNDGSTDNSDKLITHFKEAYDTENKDNPNKIDIRYYYKKNGGKGAALNTAIALSEGEIVVSIDADCIVMPDTIGNFVRYFIDPTVMAAVGNVKVATVDTLIGVIQYLEFLFSFYFKKADSMMNTIYIIGGAAGAFRRETLAAVGVYNTNNITEDIELSVRIQEAGMRIVYASDAIVYTEGASDMQGLMKQRLRWKRGRFETFVQHKSLFFSLDPRHNKLLSWLILPLGWFGDLQLLLEPFFVVFLYTYSFLIHDFSSFISGIIIVWFMFFVQIVFDDKNTRKLSFLLLSPIGWTLFYIVTVVEFNALLKSIYGVVTRKKLRWQRWQRKGVAVEIES